MGKKKNGNASGGMGRDTILARFGELALRSESLDEILTEACRLVREALGTELAKVMELQEDGETLLVRAGVGWKPGVVGEATAKASDKTSEGHALKTGEPMISPDIANETRFDYPPFLVDNGVKAIVNVPIIGAKGKPPFGILQVDSRKPRNFTEEDTTFLSTYANLISAGVERFQFMADLREREGRLRQSESRLRRIAEIETVGVIFFDVEGRITDGNAAFLCMSGFSREDLEAGLLRWDELTPPEWMPVTLQAVKELKATGQARPFEKEYIRKDGSRWWGLFAGRMLDNNTGVELVLDVTSSRKAEQALRESEARLRSLIEGIPQLVFSSRGSGERLWGSPQWVKHTGLSEQDSLGFGWLDAIHPDDRAATSAAWTKAEEKGLFSVEHRTFHVKDRSYRWFQTRATPVRTANGQCAEWFGTSTDIDDQVLAREVLARSREELEAQVSSRTLELQNALSSLREEMLQRQKAEAAVRQMQKMEAVGLLTGGIAHDFNNMLQGVAGSLQMATARAAQGRTADVVRFLDLARQTVDRAAGLTRRLLSFARRQRLEPKALDPDALVAGMADLIRRTVGPSVTLELHLRDGQARVLCDPGELESALLNLCINAHDAMPDGGRLIIGTEDVRLMAEDLDGDETAEPGEYIAISITDTGKGMQPDVLERAFEPFFTTKPAGRGTGLGLSQVYGFVRQSGGLVRITSAPGKGTTVCLLMPRRERATSG
ncbi:MAG: PAS domain S-box protein [Rhodomicrobium sp.]